MFFGRMEPSHVRPNEITFLSVLSACVQGGEAYGLTSGIKHYGCLVDLLGRAGRIKEVYDLIK